MAVVLPPDEIFEATPMPLAQSQGGSTLEDWLRVEHPKEGGMLSYYGGHPYPFKGQPYDNATEANNITKKIILASLLSLKPQKNWLNNLLSNFSHLGTYINRQYFLKKQYYKTFGVTVWDFSYLFLKAYGINTANAWALGQIAANFFEWDDAYRYRLQDLLSESSQEAWLNNPHKELNRLLTIFAQREKMIQGNLALTKKFKVIGWLLSLMLLMPKFKKAFKFALKGIDFNSLQFDKVDRYWCTQFHDYDYFGQDYKTRLATYYMEQSNFVFLNELRALASKAKNPQALINLNKVIKQYV